MDLGLNQKTMLSLYIKEWGVRERARWLAYPGVVDEVLLDSALVQVGLRLEADMKGKSESEMQRLFDQRSEYLSQLVAETMQTNPAPGEFECVEFDWVQIPTPDQPDFRPYPVLPGEVKSDPEADRRLMEEKVRAEVRKKVERAADVMESRARWFEGQEMAEMAQAYRSAAADMREELEGGEDEVTGVERRELRGEACT